MSSRDDGAGARGAGDAALPVHLYGATSRAVAGALLAIAGAHLPLLLAAVVLATDPPVTPPVLFRGVALLVVAPALAAWLLRRAAAARATVHAGVLVVVRRDLRLEVPCAAIAAVRPWRLPLPGPGVSLRLRSGARLAWGIQADDPQPLLAVLGVPGGGVPVADAERHPGVVWAHARAAGRRRRWWQPVAKFGGVGLAAGGVLFNVHQHIAYGGSFGEWYLMGPAAWWRTLAVYWATTVVYLVLWAGTWRVAAEAVALAAAAVAPSQAARVRRAVEIGCGLAYWVGVPLLLALRFQP